jgi:hypothetical protein
MFVGGEFYKDARWLKDKPTINTEGMTFLNGGKACLIVISAYLRAQGIDNILLPAYLCPTIVDTLERCGLTCTYYRANRDLTIDLQDLVRKAGRQQAVYFINYFGFPQPPAVQAYLTALREKGSVVIEDNAQAGFAVPNIGTFAFNSMRKLAAHDGGYLTTDIDMKPYIQPYLGRANRRLPLIRAYRERLADYLYGAEGDYDELVALYEQAERYYQTDMVVEGNPREREQIERMDWAGICQVRRENYLYLLEAIADIPELESIFPTLPADCMPLGLPVYVKGVSRDRLIDELGRAGIGLLIHWDGLLRDPRLNVTPLAVKMASEMLTLVTDQRTSHKQMDFMVHTIRACIEQMKSSTSA